MKKTGRCFFFFAVLACCLAAARCTCPCKPQFGLVSALEIQLRQRGDMEFAKMHWSGWEKAAAFYQEALAQRDDPQLRRRLFTACILLSLQEAELAVRNESWLQKAASLLPGNAEAPFPAWLAVAREKLRQLSIYRGGYTTQGAPELEKTPLPRETASALTNYLYLVYLRLVTTRDTTAAYIEAEKEFQRLHGDSNLAIFFRTYTPAEMDDKLAAFPDFAEMYMLRGDWYRSDKKYRAALADYQQAVEAMPPLFKARNAMATLCYSLEDYGQALFHYEKTLEIQPLEPAALFGRAICLSELQRYDESNQRLREMIEKQTFYHGEAYYYLAKNCYYRQRPEESRGYIQQAAAFIPDSVELNMLSGLLYLDRGQPAAAAADFNKALEQQPQHAEAWYFLGQAALQMKKTRDARTYFQSSIEHFNRELREFDARLAAMEGVENPDAHQQAYLQKSRRKRAAYAGELRERLVPLQNLFKKPPLPSLQALLAYLAVPATEK